MSKLDKIVADRQNELAGKIAELQRIRAVAQRRVAAIDAEIAALQVDATDVESAVAEVADLVESGAVVASGLVELEKP